MCPLPFPTSPSPAFGTNNNNNNNNKGEFYEREGKSLFKNYQVEQQQQQYLTNDDYNSPHNNSPPQSPQPFYSQQQPPQQPPQQQHHHHQQQYQQQQEDQIVTPQEFKRYYHLRQSPFEVVRAEATDPGVRERCLIPNLQVVAPIAFDHKPSSLLFFGPRGSGKTTIRMELLKSVENEKFLAVDCFKHATINDCLTNFRENTQPQTGPSQGKGMHWVDHFKKHWTSNDFISVLMSCALKKIIKLLLDPSNNSRIEKLSKQERLNVMFLAFRYANCDPHRLLECTEHLLGPPPTTGIVDVAKYGSLAVMGTCALSATSYAVNNLVPGKELKQGLAAVGSAIILGAGTLSYWSSSQDKKGLEKKAKECLCSIIPHSIDRINAMAYFLENYMEEPTTAEDLLSHYPRPLKDLQKIVKKMGFVSPMLVCDGLDEADLLDPSKYPGVLNHMVQGMCHFQILTSTFLVLFLPNTVSRLGLNDPYLIKRWRRDIFPPRELQWESDTLLQLASRRFSAYQEGGEEGGEGGEGGEGRGGRGGVVPTFEDCLSRVSVGGRVRFLSRLRTPRQMLLCCAALILRLEREGRLFARDSDLELAVGLALSNADVDA